MPIIDLTCDDSASPLFNKTIEKLVSLSDIDKIKSGEVVFTCYVTGSPLRRTYKPGNTIFKFKGGGFHSTDYTLK